MRTALVIAVVLAALSREGIATAETRRLAVLVGSNRGSGPQPALRFAEEDVDRLAEVLTELGGLSRSDLWLIKGGSIADVKAVFREVRARVLAWRRTADQKAQVLFYFSGHSDGLSLELNSEQLPFAQVRRMVTDTAGDVRLTIVDSCRAGRLLALKGGSAGPAFDIPLSEVASTGEAFIASSTAEESALESEEIRASFFSHHLISGLRGAADASGDGRVTLAEAYRYAYDQTVSATANTMVGPQHPTFFFQLGGQGEIVLTQLQQPSALIDAPAGFERMLFVDGRRGTVVLELGPLTAPRRVALPSGRYRVLAWRERSLFGTEFSVAAGQQRTVSAEALVATAPAAIRAKRGGHGLTLVAGVGPEGAIAESLTALLGVRIGLSGSGTLSPTLSLDVASWSGERFRESRLEGLVGAQARWIHSPATMRRLDLDLVATLGAEAGAGAAIQQIDQTTRRTPVGVAGLVGQLGIQKSSLSVLLAGQVPLRLVRRENANTVLLQPAVWLGVGWSL